MTTVEKTYNTNQGQSFNLAAQTVFDDLVAATVSRMNIYSYPVLGQCVDRLGAQPLDHCPAGKAPLHVQFSGPDNVSYLDLVEGRALEWYQPVHEPGQLFSYPGSLAQLRANQPQVPTAMAGRGAVYSSCPLAITSGIAGHPAGVHHLDAREREWVSTGTSKTFAVDSSLTFAQQVRGDWLPAGIYALT